MSECWDFSTASAHTAARTDWSWKGGQAACRPRCRWNPRRHGAASSGWRLQLPASQPAQPLPRLPDWLQCCNRSRPCGPGLSTLNLLGHAERARGPPRGYSAAPGGSRSPSWIFCCQWQQSPDLAGNRAHACYWHGPHPYSSSAAGILELVSPIEF